MPFSKSSDQVHGTAATGQDGIVIILPSVEAPVPTLHIDFRKRDRLDADEFDDPNEVEYYIREMKRYQARDNDDDDDDDVSYILTITDTNWPFGDPTAVTTSSNKETTVTLLFFTSTTMMWYNPYENYDSSTEIPVRNPTLTTITTTSEDEAEDSTPTSEDDPSEEPTDTATGAEDAVSSATHVDASTTSDLGITSATGSIEGAEGNDNSDLPQAAIIGISVGISVFTVVIVMVLLIFFRRRHKKDAKVATAFTGSPSPPEPPKMEEARPVEQPSSQAFVSPVVPQHQTHDHVAIPRASSALVSELEQQARFPVELGGQQPWTMQPIAQHVAHPLAQTDVQAAAPRQYQAYHPSYSQNQNQNQGFVAELPAENYTR